MFQTSTTSRTATRLGQRRVTIGVWQTRLKTTAWWLSSASHLSPKSFRYLEFSNGSTFTSGSMEWVLSIQLFPHFTFCLMAWPSTKSPSSAEQARKQHAMSRRAFRKSLWCFSECLPSLLSPSSKTGTNGTKARILTPLELKKRQPSSHSDSSWTHSQRSHTFMCNWDGFLLKKPSYSAYLLSSKN